MQEFRTADDDHPTFEDTYPRYTFAPLVAMGLAFGAWLHRHDGERVEDAQMKHSREPGPTAPAT